MGQAAQQREQELKGSTGLVRAMREVAMIPGRNGKYSQAVEGRARDQRNPTDSRPEHQQAASVQKNELRDGEVIQSLM